MRNILLLSLFTCLISSTITRPSRWDQRNAHLDQTDEREAEEVEYESNEENPAEDSFQEDEEASLNDQDPRDIESGQDEEQARGDEAARGQQFNNLNKEKYMPHALAEERADKPSNDHLLEEYSQRNKEEQVSEEASSNDSSLPKRRQSNRYAESNELNESLENTQHLKKKSNRMQSDVHDNDLDKRTIDNSRVPLDENESLFDNQRIHRNSADKREYHKDSADSSEQSYRLKQYYNTMQSDHKSMLGNRNYEISQYMLNRDRRQVEVTDSLILTSTSTEKESIFSDTVNEDDEAAIKRHIKKLSGEELEELLNSLSDEKKALLNKIMDSNHNYDTLNKREITKKAGAVEENNYIESGLSELSKIQGVSSSIDGNTESAIGPSSDTENTKQEGQTESSDFSEAKVPETTRAEVSENKAEFVDSTDGATNNVNLNANEDSKNIISSNLQSTKSENKREANPDYLNTQLSDNYLNIRDLEDPSEQEHSYSSQEDDLTQIMDDEAKLHHNQEFKREALADNQSELDDSVRSLEESFPKSDCEESGQYFESNMTPLIRVKRKDENKEIEKRAAALLPDAKVAFVPYKAENDDEDNDEGNEFDDDGFYDRTANFAKNHGNQPDDNKAPTDFAAEHLSKKTKEYFSGKDRTKLSESSPENKLDSESMSIGSDSDSVLSGVEGVDDNLMLNSGSRNRRTLQENLEQLTEEESSRILRSNPITDDIVKSAENHINIPHYQENDAFGALPRNYEGELGRYKRIRRVKPSSEIANSD